MIVGRLWQIQQLDFHFWTLGKKLKAIRFLRSIIYCISNSPATRDFAGIRIKFISILQPHGSITFILAGPIKESRNQQLSSDSCESQWMVHWFCYGIETNHLRQILESSVFWGIVINLPRHRNLPFCYIKRSPKLNETIWILETICTSCREFLESYVCSEHKI